MLYSGSSPLPISSSKIAGREEKNHMNDWLKDKGTQRTLKTTNNRSDQHGQSSFPKILMCVISCGDQSSSCRHVRGRTVQPREARRPEKSTRSVLVAPYSWWGTSPPADKNSYSSPVCSQQLMFWLFWFTKVRWELTWCTTSVCLRRSHHQNSAHAHERVPEKCFCQEH